MALFDDETDEILVELVAKNPPLYDCHLKSHKDNIVRDNIWDHIARELNKTSDDCKKRWKCIRDSYQRIKRKNKGSTGSPGGIKSKKWALLERLNFLESVPIERKTVCYLMNTSEDSRSGDKNTEHSDISLGEGSSKRSEINIEDSPDEEEIIRLKKSGRGISRKRDKNTSMQAALLQYWRGRDSERRAQIQALTEQEPDVDGIQSFCSDVGTMLKKLTPALRVEAKTKVFNIQAEYELRSLSQNSSSSTPTLDTNSQFSFTNSETLLDEPTDLSISNTSVSNYNPENTFRTFFEL